MEQQFRKFVDSYNLSIKSVGGGVVIRKSERAIGKPDKEFTPLYYIEQVIIKGVGGYNFLVEKEHVVNFNKGITPLDQEEIQKNSDKLDKVFDNYIMCILQYSSIEGNRELRNNFIVKKLGEKKNKYRQ